MRAIKAVFLLLLLATDPTTASAQEATRIVVEGYGVIETPPNVASIDYSVRGEGKSSDDAVRDLVIKSARISGRLARVDPMINPTAKDMTVTGVRGADCGKSESDDESGDAAPRLSSGPCAIAGYVARQNFTFKSKQVKDAGTMVGIAGQAGATSPSISGFSLADDRAARREAVAAAFANARLKAEAVAQAGGVKLGAIISANLDNAYSDRDDAIVVTGSRITRPDLEAPSPVTVVMNTGPINTNATLKVTFGILR